MLIAASVQSVVQMFIDLHPGFTRFFVCSFVRLCRWALTGPFHHISSGLFVCSLLVRSFVFLPCSVVPPFARFTLRDGDVVSGVAVYLCL